MNQAARYSV